MNLARPITLALLLSATAWPAFAAADFFWNCTTPDGIKYADASKCDKGDAAVKVMKGNKPAANDDGERPVGLNTGVCPANPAYCTQANYGVTEGSPRTQAILQFMRGKECDFMKRFPERCTKPH